MADHDRLTPDERAVLIVLMTEGREVGNTELYGRYGFKIKAPIRDRLSGLGLVQVGKRGSAYLHEVTDKGWRHGSDELQADFEVPARPPKVQVAAWKALAGATGRFLAATGTHASTFFAPQPQPTAGKAEQTPPADADEDLDGLIRAAYWEIAERPHQRVALSELRKHLDGAVPDAVSEALVRMFAEGRVNLTPGADQKSRRKADDEAAVRAGGEAKHFVSMASS